MAGERTEKATPHRREKARKEGDILHSRELSTAAGTLAGVLMLGRVGDRALEAWRSGFLRLLEKGFPACWDSAGILSTLYGIRHLVLMVLLPFGGVLAAVPLAALCAGVLQTGGVTVSSSTVGFHLERVNPIANLKNLFSLRGAARLGKSLFPAIFLAVFAVQRIARQWALPPFSTMRVEGMGGEIYGLVIVAAMLLFAWAAIDYAVEWRSREARLRMSRDDLREEFKEAEGNPQIRSRIRGLQRQMRRRQVKADVAKAAVVVTNPTHYAVALGFDFVSMEAPKVLAKGRNLLAEEIKAEARWAGVPIVENRDLARSLYRTVEVGQAIPVELYAAVAAILAFLYRQRVEEESRERRGRGATAHAAQGRTAQRPRQGVRS